MAASKPKKLRNITFSADADLIAAARRRAKQEESTLNDEFRNWLEQFTCPVSSNKDFDKLMNSLSPALSGSKFFRDEANER